MTDEVKECEIYIANAGLALVSPFLPHLFEELELLQTGEEGKSRFPNADCLSRGVHLLQYLVTGAAETPDHRLSLNKILCGTPPVTIVSTGIEITKRETILCNKVHASILANWPALSAGTSVAGLQQTFLQREGRLQFRQDRWCLDVDRETVDILLDQMPWSIRTVSHQWMPQSLYTRW